MAKNPPLRKCVGCGALREKPDLLRVVRDAGGEAYIDATGKAEGRGAYICKNNECYEKARKRRGLERSFKSSVPAAVYDRIHEEIIGHKENL